jgi:hypothetical protein
LVVEVQCVRKWDALNIAKTNWDTFEIEIGLIFGGAKLTVPSMRVLKIESRDPAWVIFAQI